MNSSPPRPYRMGVWAERAAQTGDRILDAFVALFWERRGTLMARILAYTSPALGHLFPLAAREVGDPFAAIEAERPDVVVIDSTTWGAMAAAVRSS